MTEIVVKYECMEHGEVEPGEDGLCPVTVGKGKKKRPCERSLKPVHYAADAVTGEPA
jgi:hypothetical protein